MTVDTRTSALAFLTVVVASVLWTKGRENEAHGSPEVNRLKRLLASGALTHPYLLAEYFQRGTTVTASVKEEECIANFTDLASALASCCGVTVDTNARQRALTRDIGQNTRHIIVVLCDGMGNAILEQHLPESSFLRRHNQCDRLRAVFPSTTPAALTTLATAQWPGQHGVPGWDLREQPGCDFPGEPSGGTLVQLRILASRIMNVRDDEPANCYSSFDDVFLVPPWSRSLARKQLKEHKRRMMYINAYNGDDFPSWYQGQTGESRAASDFSSWQIGQQMKETASPLFDTATIGETSFATLGKPEGSRVALDFFKDGIDKALHSIAQAEACLEPTFTYLYTAHPDKHMHALGTSHPEVRNLVRGMNDELDQMRNKLEDRAKLLSEYGVKDETESCQSSRIDATLIVTADHGHISVFPQDMVIIPDNIIKCLEYANIGVLGKGRHAYLHCRAGLQSSLRERWRASRELNNSFLLLTIEEASENGLFGPKSPTLRVRPRLGDFVAISVSEKTLVTPNEWVEHQHHCQGAHGSLLEAEMKIPFILCSPSQK